VNFRDIWAQREFIVHGVGTTGTQRIGRPVGRGAVRDGARIRECLPDRYISEPHASIVAPSRPTLAGVVNGGNSEGVSTFIGEFDASRSPAARIGTSPPPRSPPCSSGRTLLHAGEAETSMLLAVRPELAAELAKHEQARARASARRRGSHPIPGAYRWRQLSSRSRNGVIGMPYGEHRQRPPGRGRGRQAGVSRKPRFSAVPLPPSRGRAADPGAARGLRCRGLAAPGGIRRAASGIGRGLAMRATRSSACGNATLTMEQRPVLMA